VSTARVAVIIPFHGTAPYLDEAVASVLAQTYREYELVLVDDRMVVDGAIEARYTGIARVLNTGGTGSPGPARNLGVAETTTDLVAFLDSDDLWHPTKLARQVAALDDDPDADIALTLTEEFLSPEIPADDAPVHVRAGAMPGHCTSGMVVRRRALERVGPFDAIPTADWAEWYVRSVEACLRVTMVPEVLWSRRVHGLNNSFVQRTHEQGQYLRVLKESLDRRRAAG